MLRAGGDRLTSVYLDKPLLAAVMAATGPRTNKAAIKAALRLVVERHRRGEALASLKGFGWVGDLAAGREGRTVPSRG